MDDLQFELNGYRFGWGMPIRVVPGGFEHGAPSIRTEDTDNPVASGRLFGRDRFGGMKWTWTGFVNDEDAPGALRELRELAAMWVRERDPGDIDVMRYQLDGSTRRVYGRARRFSDTLDNRLLVGNIPWIGDFDTVDGCTYEDIERSQMITIIPAIAGGFLVPFFAPIETTGIGTRQGTIANVGGDMPSPFELTITGPLSEGSKIAGKAWQIVLQRSLTALDTLVVDTTPWNMGVRLNGERVSSYLAPSTSRLYDARLDPAGDEISIIGVSTSGTATATVRWRPASTSI